MLSVVKKKKKAKKVPRACKNHSEVSGIQRCERCGLWLCKECIEEVWHQAFLKEFIGEKRKFEKEILCSDCAKRVSRYRVLLAFFFLVVVLVAMFGALLF